MSNKRFGKHAPKKDYRTLRFKDYVTPTLAPPPASFNVLTRVYDNLKSTDPTKLFPMDGNDTLGDCTIAALAHAITTYRGMVGTKRIMPEKSVVKLYRKLSGGEDTGLNELDVLNYWRQHAVSGDEILAFASIDPKNHTHVQQAMYLGFQVQANCLEDFDAHKPWTPGKLSHDGHAVYAVAYDHSGVTVLTWGNTQQGTWGWWDECVDESYAILPPEAKNDGFAPGLNLDLLHKDLGDIAS